MSARRRERPTGGTLMVASTGGHLEELYRLRRRMSPTPDPVQWVTFDEPQSRSLLAGEIVHHVAYVRPRGYAAALGNVMSAQRILRAHRYDQVVSTGAGVAIPFIAAARAMGIRCHYIESAARSQGPSLTGKVIASIPGVRLYTQYAGWASGRWQHHGSLFDTFTATADPTPPEPARRIVVTLGTMRAYGFRRAVDACLRVLPEVATADAEVLWQVGATPTGDLPIEAHNTISADRMQEAVAAADLVIAHAGIGSALTALDRGKCPVLLPRIAAHGEHVDDHQQLIADALDTRGLAVSSDPDTLTAAHLRRAMATTIGAAGSDVAPFELSP